MPSSSPSLKKHYTLHASAGAGKTKHLIDEIFSAANNYFQSHGQFPKIAVTTFTKKATGEVKERLMAKAIQDENEPLLKSICDPSTILISTLHGIVYTFLKRTEWRSDVEIMNDQQLSSLARSTARDVLSQQKLFFNLLEHYSFSNLVDILLKYDKCTRYTPHLCSLSQEEIQNNWIKNIQQFIENHPDLKSIDSFFNKIIHQPLSINSSDVEDLKQLKKESSNKNISTSTINNFRDLVEKFHPNKLHYWLSYNQLFYEFAEIFKQRWRDKKNEKNVIQIEDLELLTLEIIRKNPASIQSFAKNWDFWFIDEYQDINPYQEKILHHFIQQAQGSWAVGDPQQSIYLFRKADPDVFERRKKIDKESIKENHYNYRSQPHLISFFNDFFKDRFQPMIPKKKPLNPTPPAAQFLVYNKEEKEENAVAQRLNELLKQGVSPGDIGILLRTNQDVSDFERKLKRLKFPVQAHSLNDVKREILDVSFLLQFLLNPFDNQNLIGLLRTPYFYIHNKEIVSITEKNQSLWPLLNEKCSSHPVVMELNKLIEKSEQEGLGETLLYCFRENFIIDFCFYQDPTKSQETNLWKFIANLKNKEREPGFRYSQFVKDHIYSNRFYDINKNESSSDPIHPHFIQMMTIHQSKGLEFDHVILPKMQKQFNITNHEKLMIDPEQKHWSLSCHDEKDETLYPLEHKEWLNQKKKNELSEQDRLLYVAMTRAKTSLTFIYPDNFFEKKKSSNKSNEQSMKQTWFDRFSYFSKIQKYFNQEQIKEIQINSEYSIKPSHLLKQDSHQCSISPSTYSSCLEPFSVQQKTKKKQIKPTEIHTEKKDKNQTSMPNNIDTLWGSIKGKQFHDLMYKLIKSKNSEKIFHSLADEEKPIWKTAIEYILHLPSPPMNWLLKHGHGEWSFTYEKNNYQIRGRIDLWGEQQNKIWIVDYKSTVNRLKEDVWRQMEYYGFVLQEQNPGKEIILCAIQPFAQKCEIRPFTSTIHEKINHLFTQ